MRHELVKVSVKDVTKDNVRERLCGLSTLYESNVSFGADIVICYDNLTYNQKGDIRKFLKEDDTIDDSHIDYICESQFILFY